MDTFQVSVSLMEIVLFYSRDDHYGGRDFRDDYGDRPHRGFRGGHGPRGGGGGGGGHPGADGGDDSGQPTMMSFKAFLGSQVRLTILTVILVVEPPRLVIVRDEGFQPSF